MNKEKEYTLVHFAPETIRKAVATMQQMYPKSNLEYPILIVTIENEKWSHDNPEEFFADYRRGNGYIFLKAQAKPGAISLTTSWDMRDTNIKVEGDERSKIEKVFEIFEEHLDESRVPPPPEPAQPKPAIFIGHGRSQQWRDLKDHLHDKHEYQVEAYEIGARAGHAIRDILEDMLTKSSFALLVMTAEDETSDGTLRARQNVIHEIGLFQGRLGFSKSIVLLEEGTDEFSNIQGIDQIRFSKNNIRETFGDVLATLRREFRKKSVEQED
jgi:predicted nucleotide-binding protein